MAHGGKFDTYLGHQTLKEALEHHAAGRLDAAEAMYRSVLAAQPKNADSMHLLGMLMNQRGNGGAAVELIRGALAIKPGSPQFQNSLGTVLGAHGDVKGAASAFGQAIRLNPNYAEAHRNLGLALLRQGRLEEAVLGFWRAVGLRSGYIEALHDLAGALRSLGRLAELVDVRRELMERQGGSAESFIALGLEYRQLRRLDDSVAMLRRAVALSANDSAAHFNLALVLLEEGEFEEGFREYEWRWRLPEFAVRRRKFSQPQWNGSALEGRTILLYTEQGLGTSVQFVRYASLIAILGGTVIVQCPSRLAELFSTVPGVCRVISGSEPPPDIDVHAPMVSLPRLFGTTLDSVPANIAYLSADAARVAAWGSRLGAAGHRFKVGLVWRGCPKPDPARSCPLAEFAALAGVDDVVFYSLQIGQGALEAKRPPTGMRLVDLCEYQHDFADTAAAISLLDLVISVDTSVAHVAGALGKPVWTLLPYLSDWRWMVGREDTPWYPTMRLFRQTRQGEWRPVLERVARELGAIASRS